MPRCYLCYIIHLYHIYICTYIIYFTDFNIYLDLKKSENVAIQTRKRRDKNGVNLVLLQ